LATKPAEEALGEIFDIRSSVEHLHNALDVAIGSTLEEKIECIYLRARQADHLTRFALRRVIETDSLTEIFKTSASPSRRFSFSFQKFFVPGGENWTMKKVWYLS
jgi:hypothetical protein